jgi:hypothetical protein
VGTLDQLIVDLRRFEARKDVVKELRKEIRKPVPAVRKAIKKRARATLPKSGGLNRWVASTRITAQVKLSGSAAGVRLRGARKSLKGKSDVNAINRGRVRHPSWGRRGRGQWHVQRVEPGFFTKPSAETDEWRKACVRALNQATEVVRRGR